jgi:hypothetical protein
MKLKTVPAISGDPATWGRFETAARCVEMGIAQGIGYEFDGSGVYGVDLDRVRSDNGKVAPEAQAIVKQLASYTEISPSGHGLHIFVTAEGADITRHRRKGGFVEIYSAGRYFTVTGNVYSENLSIESRSAELQQIHDRYLLPKQARASPIQQSAMSEVSISDSLSVGLQRDPVLRACYNGERRFGDESGSDQALMNKLDAVIVASSAMKEAVNHVGDRFGLPNGWLNMDFRNTKSYSPKLSEVSVYYKTFSNVLTVRTVAAEYLIAMKLMSGRRYKNDLSDIAGILWEHKESGKPITRDAVDKAVNKLYGGWSDIPETSITLIEAAFADGDYEKLFMQNRESETQSKDILLDFDKDYPGALKADNIDAVLEQAKRRREKEIEQTASDEEVMRISEELIEKNREAYNELANPHDEP